MLLKWTPIRAFLLAIATGMTAVVADAWWEQRQSRPSIEFKQLSLGVWVTSQISLDDIRNGRLHGVKTLVDLRPDGEAADQPPSASVGAALEGSGVDFSYIPVPHGEIPDGAVAALQAALSAHPHPVLLYCRSGSRGARTWALGEASRDWGLPAQEIRAAVAAAGFSTRDIDAAIDVRIAARAHGTN